MTPDQLMLFGGVLVAAGAGVLIWEPKLSAIVPWIKSLFPEKSVVDTKVDNDNYPPITNIHDTVKMLIQDRVEKNDETGIMCLVAFGKHLYEMEQKRVVDKLKEDTNE